MLTTCLVVLAAGFVWSTFYPASQYNVLATSIVALATAYWAKRTVQKNKNFGGSPQPDSTVTTTTKTKTTPPDYSGE